MHAKPSPPKRVGDDPRITMLRRLTEAKEHLNARKLETYKPDAFMKNAHYNPNDRFRRERQPMQQIYYKSLFVRKDQRLIAYRKAEDNECAYAFLSDTNICVYGFTPLEIVTELMPASLTPEQLHRTCTTISAHLDALTR